MRGDPPFILKALAFWGASTPHARGSTLHRIGCRISFPVYPACAGIHPVLIKKDALLMGLPRMRGDPPSSFMEREDPTASTQHARGSTNVQSLASLRRSVYPACAGIHPEGVVMSERPWSLPRMRGDPPYTKHLQDSVSQSTPHARGSTPLRVKPPEVSRVYPACAGIHLKPTVRPDVDNSLPRMRGDPPCYCRL